VIGSRFETDLLTSLGIEPALDELIEAELIDQVRYAPYAEYAFRHPLIRTVAYESQLKSWRNEVHRRLADAIEDRNPALADENAALIATHLEAAADLHESFSWHMRAGTWSNYRDIRAARMSWHRAAQVADRLPADDPDRASMRIAPRTLLCGSTWRAGLGVADTGFDELRDLCTPPATACRWRSAWSECLGPWGLARNMARHPSWRRSSRRWSTPSGIRP
jgi:adenylate cyclase